MTNEDYYEEIDPKSPNAAIRYRECIAWGIRVRFKISEEKAKSLLNVFNPQKVNNQSIVDFLSKEENK